MKGEYQGGPLLSTGQAAEGIAQLAAAPLHAEGGQRQTDQHQTYGKQQMEQGILHKTI